MPKLRALKFPMVLLGWIARFVGGLHLLLFPTHPVGGMQGCDGFFHYCVPYPTTSGCSSRACISSPCWWRPSPERRYFYWYIIIGWGRSLTVAWTGSGPMSRMSFVPPSGSISQRREAREVLPCLLPNYGILLDLGYFLALLLVRSLPAEGRICSARQDSPGSGEHGPPEGLGMRDS